MNAFMGSIIRIVFHQIPEITVGETLRFRMLPDKPHPISLRHFEIRTADLVPFGNLIFTDPSLGKSKYHGRLPWILCRPDIREMRGTYDPEDKKTPLRFVPP